MTPVAAFHVVIHCENCHASTVVAAFLGVSPATEEVAGAESPELGFVVLPSHENHAYQFRRSHRGPIVVAGSHPADECPARRLDTTANDEV